jgi:transforming growth factor-beta-induced protein
MIRSFRSGALAASLLLTTAAFAAPPAQDIVDTVVAAGSFKTLVACAGRWAGRHIEGPRSVHGVRAHRRSLCQAASGYRRKPAEARKQGEAGSHPYLPEVLGEVMAADVVKIRTAKTVNGQMLTVKAVMGSVMVDKAKVIKTDIVCSNGVIHVIDTVIMPK